MKHTPTPWTSTGLEIRHSNTSLLLATIYKHLPANQSKEEAEANAELIVKAVNNYHALESQVKELREALTETVKFYDRCVENKMFSPILARPIFSKAKQLLNKQP